MKMNHTAALLALTLAACSQDPAGVRLTHDGQPTTRPAIAAKVEPVFYNGKTYQVALTPVSDGSTSISISGMSSAQAKDATGLATSSFHHFACKDSQKAVLTPPAFDGANWRASAHCA